MLRTRRGACPSRQLSPGKGAQLPNRIIRDSCKTSQSLAKLSAEAERLFWRLVTVADDFGRFEAEPVLLLAKCFPLKVQEYRLKDVAKWYAELEACEHVRTYVSNCYHYGLFTSWDKHQDRRAKYSKFPDPTSAGICSQVQTNVPETTSSETRDNETTKTEKRDTVSDDGFASFWAAYPKKIGKGAAEVSWKKRGPPIERVLQAIAEQSQSDQWRKDGGQFIPYPAKWLNQEQWNDEVSNGTTGRNSSGQRTATQAAAGTDWGAEHKRAEERNRVIAARGGGSNSKREP